MHYHVVENTPGYMPEEEYPAVFSNLRQSGAYALDLARELRSDGYHVTGNMRSGYYAERDSGDLGRVITIDSCYESDCE